MSGRDVKRPNPVTTRGQYGRRLVRQLDGTLKSASGTQYVRDPKTGSLRRVEVKS